MTFYRCSAAYTSTPENRKIIPAGEARPLRFPFDEQYDPWGMHSRRLVDGEIDPDTQTAAFRPPVDGHAIITLETVWSAGQYLRRAHLVGDTLPREVEAWNANAVGLWTAQTPVVAGDPVAILLAHGSPDPQEILSARILITILAEEEVPDIAVTRPRRDTDPGTNPNPRE